MCIMNTYLRDNIVSGRKIKTRQIIILLYNFYFVVNNFYNRTELNIIEKIF